MIDPRIPGSHAVDTTIGLAPLCSAPPNGVVKAHFRDNTFNGIFVKEMLVLRAA